MSPFTDTTGGTAIAANPDMRVLVIEDNADLRDYLRVALESQAYDVLTAKNGREAIGYLNGHPVDIVLSDIFMPEMDGIETIAALKRRLPHARIIAMSGRPGVDYLAVARELGVARTLRKPFGMDELLNALKDGQA